MRIQPFVTVPSVDGLDAADQDVLSGLVRQLNAKRPRNRLRNLYADSKQVLVDLGIALPPSFRDVGAAIGWPGKAVNTLSRRNILEGFDATAASPADLGLVELFEGNRLEAKAPQAHTSALINSCSFGFVTNGDAAAGQPEAMITTRSALDATGTWDAYSGTLENALEVTARDKNGAPVSMVLHFPGRYVAIEWDGKRWRAFERRHAFGMLAEALPYQPDLDRPFGRSRITRSVMYLTDAMVRTLLRTEIGAEFFNAPQRYALGADEEAFTDDNGDPIPSWTVMLGRLLLLGRDEEGELPTVGQFPQQSMEPNMAQQRGLAMAFAGEMSLPVGSLGIVQDNPESAEAITARNEELGIEIEYWQRATLGPAWKRLAQKGLQLIDNSPASVEAYKTISAQWGSWSTPSEASQAQASLARVQANPRLAGTDVELERQGFTRNQIDRIKAQWAREDSRASLTALTTSAAARGATAPAQPSDPNAEATALKAKFDALGVAVRAGVDPQDAAARLGLEGIEFTGAVPVSLRLPEADAAQLEEA